METPPRDQSASPPSPRPRNWDADWSECTNCISTLRIIYGNEDEPWAEEYKFGWTVIGRARKDGEDTQDRAAVNRVTVTVEEPETFLSIPSSNSNVDSSIASFATNCYKKDTTSPEQLRETMQLDYTELHYSRTVRETEEVESIEGERFDRFLSQGIHQNDNNGNWEMPLPFKTNEISFPTNYEQCQKRLISLKKKLQKSLKILQDMCRHDIDWDDPIPDKIYYRRQKWNETSRNFQLGDIVVLCEENVSRNQWPLARVTKVFPSDDCFVRKVELLLTNGDVRRFLQRPIHKLILLYAAGEEEVKAQDATPTRSQID